ncbi:hypothetical protein, conserved in T. vivax [Trypanosoma vivax Y486]|uniref:Fucosyltransferase n=1 Tax=Trypanosoma vivax (strain Y486) TaxID=1055687 RepID=F9WN57_TRYVY|nr:hypothetical protein, conserved in T. vivax [Trypanosoma vivax Y486]|eukprot:CCD18972.1 hypothetical protein, conserved in T. vivax [Trypanosoma vivax Y486]
MKHERFTVSPSKKAVLLELALLQIFVVVLYLLMRSGATTPAEREENDTVFNATRDILVVPTNNGSFLCGYSPGSRKVRGGCILTCAVPNSTNKRFNCHMRGNRTDEQYEVADILVNHRRVLPVHRRGGPPYLTLLYSGESKESLGYYGTESYLRRHDMVISCHHYRKHYYTWARQHAKLFASIVEGNRARPVPEEQLWDEWASRLSAVAVFSSSSAAHRGEFVDELSMHYPVHSYGRFMRTNATPAECSHLEDRYELKMCVLRNYKYAIALENTEENDYVTEKVYHALLAGSIPIYWGAPNVDEFVPMGSGSIINVKDFLPGRLGRRGNWSAGNVSEEVGRFAAHLSRLEHDEAAVKHMLAWRTATDERTWGRKFLDNLHHEDPTCAACAEALVRRNRVTQRSRVN